LFINPFFVCGFLALSQIPDHLLKLYYERLVKRREAAVEAGKTAARSRSRAFMQRREDLTKRTAAVNAGRRRNEGDEEDEEDQEYEDMNMDVSGYQSDFQEAQENDDVGMGSDDEEEEFGVLENAGLSRGAAKVPAEGEKKEPQTKKRDGSKTVADQAKKGGREKDKKKSVKSAAKRKREDDGEDESEEEDDDDSSHAEMKVMGFWHNKDGAYFRVRWRERGKTRMANEDARLVLQDASEECLDILWKKHRNSGWVRAWLDRIGPGVFGSGWIDIESYARERGWPGTDPIPVVAAAASRGSVRRTEDVVAKEKAPVKAANKQQNKQFVSKLLSDKECRKHAARYEMKEVEEYEGNEESAKRIEQFLQGSVSQKSVVEGLEGEVGGEGEQSGSDKNQTRTTKPKRCTRVNHHWEECTSLSFVIRGCLSGRFCDDCGVEMMKEKKKPGETKGCWPSRTCIVSHCTQCKTVLCPRCKGILNAGTPARTTPGRAPPPPPGPASRSTPAGPPTNGPL
jgi:hypothetical protein